jgi:hypothetical protein
MLKAKDLARPRNTKDVSSMLEFMGDYDHVQQRRWVGSDASLIKWSMKSDTTFDGESTDPD